MSASESGAPYDGLEGLRRANPVELAAAVFVDLFNGASLDDPIRPGTRLEQSFFRLAGRVSSGGSLTRAASWLGLTMSGSPKLQPFVVETLALWQFTRVAASRPAGGQAATVLVMMRRGEDLLRAEHPVGFLRDLLMNGPSEY